MPNERYLEILVSRSVGIVFGPGYSLVGQQLTLPSGRVDLFLVDSKGCRHIVELKKDAAKPEAVDQVHRYVTDFRRLYSGRVEGWVVANSISPAAAMRAAELSVRTLSVPEERYPALMEASGLSIQDMYGDRVAAGILLGGGVQTFRKNGVVLEEAVSLLPPQVRACIVELGMDPRVSFSAGKMQIIVLYGGIKIGGMNSSHRQFYVSSNVVISKDDEDMLLANGFLRVTKSQATSSHVHVYWKSKLTNTEGAVAVFRHFFAVVDKRVFTG